MTKIVVEYSGDFGDDTRANEIYSSLRDRGFEFKTVSVSYVASRGISSAVYDLANNSQIPEESDLELALENLNLTSIRIIEESSKLRI